MCQSKAAGGKRCGKGLPKHHLFHNASTVRKGLNAEEDMESLKTLNELEQVGNQWRGSLTEDEEEDIQNYQIMHFEMVNSHLRGIGEAHLTDKAKEHIVNLDTAIAKAPDSPTDRLLYRSVFVPTSFNSKGTTKKERLEAWISGSFSEGETVTFPEYMSTTVDSDLAVRNNGRKSKKGIHAVLEIVSKTGAVLHQKGREGSWGVTDDEKEILLARGKTFKVVKVFKQVTFESTYKHGVDNQNKKLMRNLPPSERVRAKVPVIQLVEVESETEK